MEGGESVGCIVCNQPDIASSNITIMITCIYIYIYIHIYTYHNTDQPGLHHILELPQISKNHRVMASSASQEEIIKVTILHTIHVTTCVCVHSRYIRMSRS